jgi:hypothetical protein
VKHHASRSFWRAYDALPQTIKFLAHKNFELLQMDTAHPSLHFKQVGRYWSARVGRKHRALAVQDGQALVWFWIGDHDAYERLIATGS